MNNALVELYGADNLERLASKGTSFNHSIWDNVVKWLHSRRGFDIEDKPVRALMNETYRVLSEGVSGAITEEVPEELTRSLLNNTFIFSGFKTYHEMKQASALLRSSKGGFKSFDEFYRDVKKIDNTYNRSYLAAEYEFAVQSTQMAVRWKDWEEMGDRYLLQYRTAGDERVREEHAALNNTTLPMDDKFWDSYLPPLGWRCRCTVVQVRKGKYRISDSDAACKAGEHATSLPKQKIFRFNPGKTGKVFPPKHPYLPKGCGSCELALGKIKLSIGTNKEICKTCIYLHQCLVNDYEEIQHGKGKIRINKMVNRADSDFDKLYQIAEYFAERGSIVELPPKSSRPEKFVYDCIYKELKGTKYYGKCPDLKIDGVFYEHEGFVTNNPKRAFSNMVSHGLKQSNRIIVEKPNLTEAYMKRVIKQRIMERHTIDEVWIKEEDKLRLLYKKSEE